MATLKQKKAFDNFTENHGNTYRAMRKAGYKHNTAKKPSNLTNSVGWKELMDKYIPEDLLAKKHKELLTIPIKKRTYIKGDLETETEELDTNAIKAGLDMAYKLRGSYSPEKVKHLGDKDNPIMIKSEGQMTKEEIDKYLQDKINASTT